MNRRLRNHPLRVQRVGVDESVLEDIYHRMLQLSWTRFCGLILLTYLLLNLIFALLIFAAPGSVANIGPHDFFSCFAFSVQTFSTIGYGFFNPLTPYAHLIVTIEAAFSLLTTALLTGMVFAKFSRPNSRVVFTENILWTTFNGKTALEVRLGNIRANRVFEGRAKMTLLRDEVTAEGERLRRLVDLKLLRSETSLFALSWTLYHLIDEASPLYGMTPEEMTKLDWEINVIFVGLDQDLSQHIASYTQYHSRQIVRARKFSDMIFYNSNTGVRTIDFSKLHEVEV
jgi:inward rectifier potassium channel